MVNRASEFEKQVAEKEAEDWKTKFEKLVETVRKLDELGEFRYGDLELYENVRLGLELARIKIRKKNESCEVYKDAPSKEGLASGSLYITTPAKDSILERNRDNMSCRGRVNRMLSFEDDEVDLCDSETEKRSMDENYEDEDVEAGEVNKSNNLSGRKRKLVITSDSENDDEDEDNIPISQMLKKLKPTTSQEIPDLVDTPTTEENRSRKRRVLSRQNKKRVSKEISASTERLVGIPTSGNAEDDETDEDSVSESESLDGFIVDDEEDDEDDDDDEDSHETDSEKSDESGEEKEEEEKESDGEIGYAEVMSRLRRDNKPKKQKWEYEADMLADFGKDPELCMRAVCVLYRFQSEDEKASSSSHHCNGRGFSKLDAIRGTRIGQFLTDGDPEGDLKKSVEELESYSFKDVEICGDLARKYSKQLFEIYNNREVPFFVPPPSP